MSAKKAEILLFEGVKGKDIYNPTAPFSDRGKTYIAARVEPRENEIDSRVMFFMENKGTWTLDREVPSFELQDPFIARVETELIFGGVKIFHENQQLNWKTLFYRGKTLPELRQFAEGPVGMKDIRLVQLPTGKIGVFTRPQGGEFGKGKIGYKTINSLEELAGTDLYSAEIIEGQFDDETWGGVNEAHTLDRKTLGVLGHLAKSEQAEEGEIKHYCPMVFAFNYETGEASPIKVIAERKDFPEGEGGKRSPELDDVVFSGGLRPKGDEAELYCGLSDVQAGKITLPNPFKG